jgi:oxygen-independent coproporphyrinogen-3 oxidase
MSCGIYVHIPFCLSKCDYCDFLSFANSAESLKKDYYLALCKEIELVSKEYPNLPVDTIYFGGGTPTVLPSYWLNGILNTIRRCFRILPKSEITVETNPSAQSKSIVGLHKARVNRISFGLQSTCNEQMSALNRTHTMEGFLKNFQTARRMNMNNVNIDLMFGLPNQDLDQWSKTLETVIALAPEHISAYSLTPAEGTPLYDEITAGRITLPDDSLDRNMYHLACSMLTEAGYSHYELSNFAKPNKESKHNINCWKRKPYLGFGLGAHSFYNSLRWNNTKDIQRYLDILLRGNLQGFKVKEDVYVLSREESMSETMILGLRLTQGICIREFIEAFGISPVEKYKLAPLIADGLLVIDDSYIRLTPRGMDLANQVFMAFK